MHEITGIILAGGKSKRMGTDKAPLVKNINPAVRNFRRVNYLRISLTDRCNLRCSYCMPKEGIFARILKGRTITAGDKVEVAEYI